jgi:hypothetical protein
MMWNSIWHLRGSVALDGATTAEEAINAIERLLARQRKPVTERGVDFLCFHAPLWRAFLTPNWFSMYIYDQGRFWIDHRPDGPQIRYDLGSFQALVYCILAGVAFFNFGLPSGIRVGLFLAISSFGWLYGMNILLALIRVPSAVRAAIREA